MTVRGIDTYKEIPAGMHVKAGSGSMECPKCGAAQNTVTDSRPSGKRIRRRRACMKCTWRFTTFEMTAEAIANRETEIVKLLSEFTRLASELQSGIVQRIVGGK